MPDIVQGRNVSYPISPSQEFYSDNLIATTGDNTVIFFPDTGYVGDEVPEYKE